SRSLAKQMRENDEFISVNNGGPVNQEADPAHPFNNRYLLSPAVTPAHFGTDGLHAATGPTVGPLPSPAGLLVTAILPQDPTGEMATLIAQCNSGQQPRKQHGIWIARDGNRALLLAQTRALGSDTDAQEAAINHIRDKFAHAKAEVGQQHAAASSASLILTGPGVFGVNARNTISTEASMFAIISATLIMGLLFFTYRSGM